MSFFTELKRRNVFKVGAAYMVVAWLIIQFINNVAGPLNFPNWIPAFFIVLLGLGLPVALILAWAFELTPDGVRRTAELDPGESIRRETGQRLNLLIISGLSLAVVFMAVDNYVLDNNASAPLQAAVSGVAPTDLPTDAPTGASADASPPGEEPAAQAVDIPELSLAVLPFSDLSPDRDQEYFSDGLSEELLNKLAQVDDLLVTARTSSFFYKGRNEDMRTIGQQLGVNYILEGSVRKAGSQVRITAQLIQAENGFHLWSQTYDRELADIFELQDELASAVTTALSITLGTGDFDRPGMTRDVAAYEAYLQAANEVQLISRESVRAAIDHIERAVSLDPGFYMAWARMDDIYAVALELFPPDQTAEFVNRRAYARELLLAQAGEHPVTRAYVIDDMLAARKFAEAEQLALALIADTGGNNSPYSALYANLLSIVGRNRDAVAWWQSDSRVNPINPRTSLNMSRALLSLNRVGEARVELERGLTSATGEMVAVLMRGYWHAALQEGDMDKAKAAWVAAMGDPVPGSIEDFWLKGDYEGGLQLIRDDLSNDDLSFIFLSSRDQYAMVLGDAQLALDTRRRSGNLATVWMDYASEMRKLPDFKLFMEEQGILDYWRSTGNWADKCRPLAGNDDFECF